MLITLNFEEMMEGVHYGAFRRVKSIINGRDQNSNNLKGGEFDRWQADIEGALAERAVAKALGMVWTGSVETGNFKDADVGSVVQVRYTHHKDRGGLLLYDSDNEDHFFVLVDGEYGTYNLVGWMPCALGKKELYRGAHGWKAWLVPRTELWPITELQEVLYASTT